MSGTKGGGREEGRGAYRGVGSTARYGTVVLSHVYTQISIIPTDERTDVPRKLLIHRIPILPHISPTNQPIRPTPRTSTTLTELTQSRIRYLGTCGPVRTA